MATSNRSTASRSSVPTRATRKSAAKGAAQHANGAGLKTLEQQAKEAMSNGTKPKTDDVALHVPVVQHDVLVNSIRVSTAGFRAAINLEIAVACAVFIDQGDTGTQAKKELYSVYADAGYDCKVGGEGRDYKTVNRRIGFAAQFFDSLEDKLENVTGAARDEAAIQALVSHFAGKYNFRSMSDVQEAAGVVPVSRQKRTDEGGGGEQTQQPATQQPPQGGAQPDTGDRAVMAAMQQAGKERNAAPVNGQWVQVDYEGATIRIPTEMKTEALADLGIKLMTAAREMHGAATVVPAVLNEVFKEAVATH